MFGKTVGMAEQALAAAGLRHQVIANNLANANTPEFQASAVQFESLLSEALARETSQVVTGLRADPRHIPIGGGTDPLKVQPAVVQSPGVVRFDGNTVDPEHEMALLAANQIWHAALVRSLSEQFNRYRLAITEGRR